MGRGKVVVSKMSPGGSAIVPLPTVRREAVECHVRGTFAVLPGNPRIMTSMLHDEFEVGCLLLKVIRTYSDNHARTQDVESYTPCST